MQVLVVRTDFLGDTVLSSTVLEMLANYPDLTLDALVTDYNQAAWRYCPHLRQLICLDHRPDSKQLATNAQQLAGRYYDLVLVLNRDLRIYRYLVHIQARAIVGFRLGRRSFKTNWFCKLASFSSKYTFIEHRSDQHEVCNLHALTNRALAFLGLQPLALPAQCRFYLPPESTRTPVTSLDIVLNASGRAGYNKHLNDSLLISLLQLLPLQLRVGIISLPVDVARIARIVKLFPSRQLTIISEENIYQLAAQLQVAAVFVSGDGGLLHIAAGLGLACIGIFHDQNVSAWHPWTPRQLSLQAATRNIYDISPLTIIDGVKQLTNAN